MSRRRFKPWVLIQVVALRQLNYLRVGAFPDRPTNQSYILNVSLGNSVPEASTWAMMLLGFAGMGVALRRRRSLQTRTVGA